MKITTKLLATTLVCIIMTTPMVPIAQANPFTPCECESWVSYYTGPENMTGVPTNLYPKSTISPDGATIFVTGTSRNPAGNDDFATVAYNAADGSELWTARYNGPGADRDSPRAIVASPDGTKVIVTGRSNGDTMGTDFATVAYGADDGAEFWVARHDGAVNDMDLAEDVGMSPDGSIVYVFGTTTMNSDGSSRAFTTIAYDAASGSELWTTISAGPTSQIDHPVSLAVSPDGLFVVVTGYNDAAGTHLDYVTIAYDAMDGSQEWSARYTAPGGTFVAMPLALAISPDSSRVFVTGESRSGTDLSTKDWATVSYDSDSGSELWVARYSGPDGVIEDLGGSLAPERAGGIGYSIAVSPDGTMVFVTGHGGGETALSEADYTTIAYDSASGQESWVSRYEGPYQDYAFDLEVSPDGTQVIVTGQSRRMMIAAGGTGVGLGEWRDLLTISYNANTGVELWSARFGEHAIGLFPSVVISPDSSMVYVTGDSKDATGITTNSHDYVTVAYQLPAPLPGSALVPGLPPLPPLSGQG